MNCRLVYVSMLSDNHFEEAKEMLRTVYDRVSPKNYSYHYVNFCLYTYYKNVELCQFPFYAYPPQVSLQIYAWKPLIYSKTDVHGI